MPGIENLWKKISKSDSFRPARIVIPEENIEESFVSELPFERHNQYFLVTVNQMFLTYQRKWFKDWDPFVFITSRFLYDGVYHEVPFFVGQKMLEGLKVDIPSKGMIFENTKVAGLHPYRGGDFGLTVVLGRSLKNDYLRKVMNVIESASKTYLGGFGTALLPYLQIGKIVMDSFEDLLDSKDVEPLIGYRIDFNPEVNNNFKPGYFALINKSEDLIDAKQFFVKDQKLFFGQSLEHCLPYREEDYVLYSVLGTEQRGDIESLPYYKEYLATRNFISNFPSSIPEDHVKSIKGKIFSLLNNICTSPDLIRSQAKKEMEDYKNELNTLLDDRMNFGAVTAEDDRDEWEKEMDEAIASVLD